MVFNDIGIGSYVERMNIGTGPLSLQACLYCKQRKRKCDKMLPTCSLCTEKRVICDYTTSTTNHTSSKDPPTTAVTGTDRLAATRFLDSTFWSQNGLQLPLASVPLSKDIMDFIGNPWQVAEQWFRETSPWLPILSNMHFSTKILQPLPALSADVLLLLACMKVMAWAPPSVDSNPRTPSYKAAKRSLLEAEIVGVLSVSMLQAMIILSLYEIGHAIYPAAYLSIGSCARYGMALGIDGDNATDLNGRELSLLHQEERRRAWWVIIILDRYMNLSCPTRSLSTRDPGPEDLLPIDDQPWERAIVKPEQMFTAASPADVRMGSFARLAQSTYLLSRVLLWKADTSSDANFKEEQRQQLDRTLHSLISLSLHEGRVRRMTICAQTAISYSALIILHSPSFLESDISVQPITMEMRINLEKRQASLDTTLGILRPAAEATSLKSRAFLSPPTGLRSTSQTSPLLLHWAYLAASIYLHVIFISDVDEQLGPLEILKTKLKVMSERWLVAGEYLRLLEAKEAAIYHEAVSMDIN